MQHRAPLGMASSFTILILDWFLFAGVSAAPSTAPVSTLLAALATAMLAYLFERDAAADAFAPRPLRALGAGVAVAVPLPVYGTFVAVSLLLWTALRERRLAR